MYQLVNCNGWRVFLRKGMLFATETLAELLQVSPCVIRRECEEGRLPFVRIQGEIQYRESDVRAYLEHHGPPEEKGK
jgi:excisionase family DNA binding protein